MNIKHIRTRALTAAWLVVTAVLSGAAPGMAHAADANGEISGIDIPGIEEIQREIEGRLGEGWVYRRVLPNQREAACNAWKELRAALAVIPLPEWRGLKEALNRSLRGRAHGIEFFRPELHFPELRLHNALALEVLEGAQIHVGRDLQRGDGELLPMGLTIAGPAPGSRRKTAWLSTRWLEPGEAKSEHTIDTTIVSLHRSAGPEAEQHACYVSAEETQAWCEDLDAAEAAAEQSLFALDDLGGRLVEAMPSGRGSIHLPSEQNDGFARAAQAMGELREAVDSVGREPWRLLGDELALWPGERSAEGERPTKVRAEARSGIFTLRRGVVGMPGFVNGISLSTSLSPQQEMKGRLTIGRYSPEPDAIPTASYLEAIRCDRRGNSAQLIVWIPDVDRSEIPVWSHQRVIPLTLPHHREAHRPGRPSASREGTRYGHPDKP